MEDAQEVFDRFPGDQFVLQLAMYYYALQTSSFLHTKYDLDISGFYLEPARKLIMEVLSSSSLPEKAKIPTEILLRYSIKLSDLTQAKTLQGLGKGKFFTEYCRVSKTIHLNMVKDIYLLLLIVNNNIIGPLRKGRRELQFLFLSGSFQLFILSYFSSSILKKTHPYR